MRGGAATRGGLFNAICDTALRGLGGTGGETLGGGGETFGFGGGGAGLGGTGGGVFNLGATLFRVPRLKSPATSNADTADLGENFALVSA